MIQNKSILALILARGGSKRLPGKNVKLLCGKPMVAWTIKAAKQSKYVDRVIVSTDSDEIAKVAKKYGADVPFIRPDELASDNATSTDAVLHTLDWLKEHEKKSYDYLLLLQPTSPLRTERHIDEAVRQMVETPKLEGLNSFYLWDKKPDWMYAEDAGGFLRKCLDVQSSFKNTIEFLVPNGAIYLVRTDVFLEQKTSYPKRLGAYIMTRNESIDVDTMEDFELANLLLQKRNV